MKRKRESRLEDDQTRLKHKLYHAVKEVKQVGKKAKTFELQRQVKRLKSLRQKEEQPNDVIVAEAQLSALKDIDTDHIACHALHNKVKKDHVLATNELVMEAMTSMTASFTSAEPKTPLAIMQSRLLSSKLLATETAKLISELRAIIQPPTPVSKDDEAESEAVPDVSSKNRAAEAISETSDDGQEDDGGWESGSVHSQQSVNAAVDDSEEDDVAREDKHTSSDASSQPSVADGEDESSSNEEKSAKRTAKKAKLSESSAPSTSTFLPSLAVGFTRGDSESDWSDSEAKFADGARKNRRGQRARRAIWEKKYGRNAAHVKKQREIQAEERKRKPMAPPVDHGWGKRGPQQLTQGSRAQPRPHVQAPASSRAPPRPPMESKSYSSAPISQSQQTRPLHPSWEAKRKQAEKNSAGIVRATGTKIKFTD